MMSATEEAGIILATKPAKTFGASLARVLDSIFYVESRISAGSLARALESRPGIHVLGVVEDGIFLGTLVRERFFNQLGRPYGWEILAKRPVLELMQAARRFGAQENVFAVAAALKGELELRENQYYGIVDADSRFQGIFSSKSLLVFLASLSQKEIEMAGLLQERLFAPKLELDEKHFSLRAFARPAKGMGGDFYYCQKLHKDQYFLAIGDVSGKGASASVVTSIVWGMLHIYDYRRGLCDLISELNSALVRTFHLERHLTAIFMIWDFRQGIVRLADMGHGLCFFIHQGKVKRLRLPKANYPLGIMEELEAKIYKLSLKSGDCLCAYTDGLIEQRNHLGEELGEKTLLGLAAAAAKNPKALEDSILLSFEHFKRDLAQSDDATWLRVQVN